MGVLVSYRAPGRTPDLLCPDRVAQLQADLIDARRDLEAARAKVAELEACVGVVRRRCFLPQESTPEEVGTHMDRVAKSWVGLQTRAETAEQALAAEREAHAALRGS